MDLRIALEPGIPDTTAPDEQDVYAENRVPDIYAARHRHIAAAVTAAGATVVPVEQANALAWLSMSEVKAGHWRGWWTSRRVIDAKVDSVRGRSPRNLEQWSKRSGGCCGAIDARAGSGERRRTGHRAR